MYLKDTMLEHYGNFEIDLTAITLHTLNKHAIELPYNGSLPYQFEGADNTRIFMFVRPGDVRVVLYAEKDGKKLHAGVDAVDAEIDGLMWRFFFESGRNNTYHTRFDNGLNRYWLGCYQTEYMFWRKITLESYILEVIQHLPDDKRTQALKWIEYVDKSATA